jgi:hypothetical protein
MIAYRLEASYREVGFTPIDLQFWERDRIAETARDIVAGRGQRERRLDFSSIHFRELRDAVDRAAEQVAVRPDWDLEYYWNARRGILTYYSPLFLGVDNKSYLKSASLECIGEGLSLYLLEDRFKHPDLFALDLFCRPLGSSPDLMMSYRLDPSSVDAVEHIHQHLLRIAESGISTLSIRYERKEDIGKVRPVNDGTTIRWTDNAPAWAVHRAAFENKRWSTADFDAFIQSLPVRMFEAPRPSVRDAGYYVAHLVGVKNSPASAVDLSPDDRLVRFMRNVHPMNHFYVPNRTKGTGHRYGEDPTVIAFIAAEYEKRFGGLWRQFIRMTAGERLRAMTGVGSMRVSFHTGNEGQAKVEHGVKATSADSDYSLTTGKLCTPIAPTDLIPPFRSWCGDDEKGHNRHNGTVRLSESPLQIIVRWRRSPESSTKLVGCYRLDLDALLAEGYIRSDKTPGEVRLQFVHEGGSIYIQHLPARRLRVGCFL